MLAFDHSQQQVDQTYVKSSFPKCNEGCVIVHGLKTKIFCTSKRYFHRNLPRHMFTVCPGYTNQHFIVITQISKFGTLIESWAEESKSLGADKIYRTRTLLGKREDALLDVYCRQIMTFISQVSDKPLLVSISLKEEGRDTETFQAILNKLVEIATWTS